MFTTKKKKEAKHNLKRKEKDTSCKQSFPVLLQIGQGNIMKEAYRLT